MQSGLVSIMMPAYNAEAYIEQAINSVLAQSYTQWELVIVDDGSKDHTGQILSQYNDPRIRVFHQENQGEAAARNTALKKIQGEFLAFLDADDLYLPHHLESLIEYLLANEQMDGVYTDGYYIDQIGRQLQTLSSRRRGPFLGNIFEEVVYGSDVFGPPVCVVLRTSPIVKYGLEFDRNIVIGPDWDFFMKYADQARFGYADQITCLYRLHTSNISLRTGFERRALELAKCRVNAIKMKNFSKCTVSIRYAVFYDLLINLLIDFPQRQTEIIRQAEFNQLPDTEQARLLRLMASKTMIYGKDHAQVEYWLEQSRKLNSSDWRTLLLLLLFRIHPKILSKLLKAKSAHEIDPRLIPPFADVKLIDSH